MKTVGTKEWTINLFGDLKMKKLISICAVATTILAVCGGAQAIPEWRTITFTGTDMFNYTTTVALRAAQDAPRRVRDWAGATIARSDGDANLNGTNDFAEWASTNLSGFGFSYFNLWGMALDTSSWNQPYQAVQDNGDLTFGVNSWKNQTVNGVAVNPGMGEPGFWDGGIVLANQTYNLSNAAFPVWRAPTGTQVTMANAASLTFSVDVLMENPGTAYEPEGGLRVYFGGFNAPQGVEGQDVSGIMLIPEPGTMLLLASGLVGLAGYGKRRFKN